MRRSHALLAAFLACVLSACATTPGGDAQTAPAPRAADSDARDSVLLISLDGFRADYLDLGITPNLSRIAREGARARWMTPSYPSLTFPNHYAIVTGLVPDHQGMIHNTMLDPALGTFKLSDRMAVGDARWWGGEPLWVGAEKAGLRTGTMYWPGSEAAVGGVRPTHWFEYTDQTALPLDTRVDTVLGWLSAPGAQRVRFATLYIEKIDKAGHEYGPDSAQTHAVLRSVDAAIGRLLDGLSTRGLLDRVNIVVVSDHGMATVPPGNVLPAEDLVPAGQASVITIGQVVTVQPKPGFDAQVARRLVGAHPHYDCWRRQDMPERWRTGTHPRTPAIVCQMHEGWDMVRRDDIPRRPKHDRGSHGYDPALPSMRALFVARGPAFRHGATIDAFDNVDVYPLLARLIGIPAAPNDGRIEPLLPALRDSTAR